MSANRTIVYVTGRHWTRQGAYHRALALARSTGAAFQVVSDHDSDEARPDVIRRALPDDTVLVVSESGTHGGIHGALGRTGDRAWLRRLPCSVWMLPTGVPPRSRTILAAVELRTGTPEPLDEAVVATASLIAAAEGARLLLLHAWTLIGEPIVSCPVRGIGPPRARRVLMRLKEERRQRLDALLSEARSVTDAQCLVNKGAAPQVIRHGLDRTGADMLVMGYRARTGFWGLVQGNLAEEFVGEPRLSLVAVRSHSPVRNLRDTAVSRNA